MRRAECQDRLVPALGRQAVRGRHQIAVRGEGEVVLTESLPMPPVSSQRRGQHSALREERLMLIVISYAHSVTDNWHSHSRVMRGADVGPRACRRPDASAGHLAASGDRGFRRPQTGAGYVPSGEAIREKAS